MNPEPIKPDNLVVMKAVEQRPMGAIQTPRSSSPLSDHIINEILAAEAQQRASNGEIPAMAPGPSPEFKGGVLEVWEACEQRLFEHGASGTLSTDYRAQGQRLGNTRNITFAMKGLQKGLWVSEGTADNCYYKDAPLPVLAENQPYLIDLERLLGIKEVVESIAMAVLESRIKQG